MGPCCNSGTKYLAAVLGPWSHFVLLFELDFVKTTYSTETCFHRKNFTFAHALKSASQLSRHIYLE